MEVARFEPRRISSKYLSSCAVTGCNSKSHKDLTVSFHQFPVPGKSFVKMGAEKVDRFLVWKTLLNIDRITVKTKVCSLHFLKSDYFFPEIKAQKRKLKQTAVPSCNLPDSNDRNEENKASGKSSRSVKKIDVDPENSGEPVNEILFVNCKVERGVDIEEENLESDADMETCTPEFFNFQSIFVKTEAPSEPFFKDAAVQVSESPIRLSLNDRAVQVNANFSTSQFPFQSFIKKTKKSESSVKDAEIQVNTECFLPSVIHCIKSNDDLRVSTGIDSFDVLDTIAQRMTEICGDKFEHLNMRMNTKQRVIMTYMKLKHNLSYTFLSVIFKYYTPKHCQRIITETIEILSKCSKDGIPWPSINDIPKNLQKYFQPNLVAKAKQKSSSCRGKSNNI